METLIIIASCLVQLSLGSGWGYFPGNGPSTWSATYPDCAGSSQSPININDADSTDIGRCDLLFSPAWGAPHSFDVTNNGHSVQLDFNYAVYRTRNCDWGTHRALQMHFHWGCRNTRGSEHQMEGEPFPLEMHIVHQEVPDSSEEDDSDQVSEPGLLVLAFFFKVTAEENPSLTPILDSFHDVEQTGQTSYITNYVLYDLIDEALDGGAYYQYDGSLTTPSCSETVKWNVVSTPLSISRQQLAEFRNLEWHDDNGFPGTMCDNFRPVQQLNGRQISRSPAIGQI